ncbi:MAG: YggU family protein [Desulfobulbus propionicus]|nr:MAG: YggU family protein [Desulfobulbus propionicus]
MPFLHTSGDGSLQLRLYVQPRAGKNEVVGVHGDRLKLRLTAPPVEGRANKEVVSFLAGQLGLKRGAVALKSGKQSRQKLVVLRGVNEQVIRDRLMVLLAET